jgi:hypothetical protein
MMVTWNKPASEVIMITLKLGSSLKALLGPRQASQSDFRESINLSELQEACARLTSQLDDASLSRTELMTVAAGLEPVGRQLLRVLKDSKERDGHTRATHLVEDALHNIYDCLYSIQPFRPYIWPAALRAKLRRALQSIAYALVALRWAGVQATASAS